MASAYAPVHRGVGKTGGIVVAKPTYRVTRLPHHVGVLPKLALHICTRLNVPVTTDRSVLNVAGQLFGAWRPVRVVVGPFKRTPVNRYDLDVLPEQPVLIGQGGVGKVRRDRGVRWHAVRRVVKPAHVIVSPVRVRHEVPGIADRKSTRLNSS